MTDIPEHVIDEPTMDIKVIIERYNNLVVSYNKLVYSYNDLMRIVEELQND